MSISPSESSAVSDPEHDIREVFRDEKGKKGLVSEDEQRATASSPVLRSSGYEGIFICLLLKSYRRLQNAVAYLT